MTAHLHATFVEGCYRCELGRDESEHDERGQVVVAAVFAIDGPVDDDLFEAVRQALMSLGASDIEIREEAPDA